MDKQNFIMTSDQHTAEILRNSGYKELPKQGQLFCFINDNKLMFSDNKNVVFSNNLCV